MNIEKLKKSLPSLKGEWLDNGVSNAADLALEVDGKLLISAEMNDSVYWLDYWGDFRDGLPYIHPALEEWAKKHGGYWEWEHPGAISFAQ